MKLCSMAWMCVALLALASFSFGQGVTTASFSGSVTDKNRDPLPGAVVNAVHEPTGTRYSTVTRASGSYRILNTRVGGPYTFTATMTGFKTEKEENIFVRIGEDKVINFQLSLDTVEETLVVVANSNPIINPSRTGAASNVSTEAIERLPTINRDLIDFARTSPFFSKSESNDGPSSLTIAGRNNRYNSILIDGSVNNDLFGLAASGAPGGQAEASIISLDAIQEIQLLVSPYDVRQGGFSGGGINAITRTGANDLEGSVYWYNRSESLIGDGPLNNEIGEFSEDRVGFRLGGPILKDKAFFFVSFETRSRERPSGWAIRADGATGSGQNFGRLDEAERFRNVLINDWGYDPGGFEEATRPTDSDNLFVRFDFNLNPNHRLTVRHNFVDAENLITRNDNNTFNFPGDHQFFPSETNSTVVQLNSTFGNVYNEFRIAFQTVKDRRTGVGGPFPWVEVALLGGAFAEFEAGTERFSTANALDQEILEITDDVTFYRGNHTITFGTHNELFNFDNLFIRENFGAWRFRSLEDFERGRAYSYNYSFSADPSDPQRSAKFDVQQLGLYAGAQWNIRPNLTLTYGLRLDVPFFPDTPSRNPLAELFSAPDGTPLRTDVTADGNLLWSPRLGFNWDINSDSTNQLRGGLGVFSGRTPYVWLSNQYSNTGIEFDRISIFLSGRDADGNVDPDNFIQFVGDPNNPPTDFPRVNSSGNEIDLIDPDFELPQVLRWNLAYDRELGLWGMFGTAELIYSKNLNEILYQNINFEPSGQSFFDGRLLYQRVNNDLRDVIFLSNTSEGNQFSTALSVERPMRDGLAFSASYLFGESESVNDGTSSQARSNWRFNETIDPNGSPLGVSDFDVRHRINLSLSYQFKIWENAPTNVSLFYNAQSGRPYSNTFANDVNGDRESNDLLYVPASEDEVIITGTIGGVPVTWADFNAYIEGDEGLRSNRGRIVDRNDSRGPWRRNLDFRVAQDISFGRYRFQLTLDILNFLNLLDSDSGSVFYVNNGEISPVRYNGTDAETGKPIYNIQSIDLDQRFTLDDFRSRYQGQLGVRFSF